MIVDVPVVSAVIAPFVPVLSIGDSVPDIRLIDQSGRPLALRGVPSIVSFAYTRCPDARMCGLVTAKFSELQRLLRGTRIRLVEVTLDPAYDRPPELRRFAVAVGARAGSWDFATGTPAALTELRQRFGIVAGRTPSGILRHTDMVAVVSARGSVDDIVAGTAWAPRDVAAVARRDAGLAANPAAAALLALFASAGAMCNGRGGGLSPIVGLAIFAALLVACGLAVMRLGAATFFGRP